MDLVARRLKEQEQELEELKPWAEKMLRILLYRYLSRRSAKEWFRREIEETDELNQLALLQALETYLSLLKVDL